MSDTIAKTNSAINQRYEFVLLFDVQDGNPNGDPDAGNLPRIDPQSLQGLVTDGCIKRKIRNAIAAMKQDASGSVESGYELYFQPQDAVYEKRVLNLIHQSAWDALGLNREAGSEDQDDIADDGESDAKSKKKSAKKGDKGDYDNVTKARQWMCANFYDIRAFGAVMTTGVNCGQVRGPVQITFARSIDPIVPLEFSITRKSVTTEKDALKQINKADDETKVRFGTITGTMGRKNTVPYGLYRLSGFINPYLARQTGFTHDDLQLLWDSMKSSMWEIDRSASRGLMATRGLYVFEHNSPLGSAPANELLDRIKVGRVGDETVARSFDDYRSKIEINDRDLPLGVKLHRLVG